MVAPARTPRFLVDVMCGKLVVYLRVCGYDTEYALDRDAEADERVLALATAEDRTVVTRDEQLASRAPDAILLTERDVEDQLRELAAAGVDLSVPPRPTRCGRCNGELDAVDVDGDADVDPPAYVPDEVETGGKTTDGNRDRRPDEFYRCRDCGQWFWKGSHWDRMTATLAGL